MTNILKSNKLLIIKNKDVILEELLEIEERLKKYCIKNNIKYITAPQIGIFKNVAYIDIKNPILLANPVIKNKSEKKVVYIETCLGVSKKPIRTIRNIKIDVETLNFANVLTFSNDNELKNDNSYLSDEGLYECVCVQQCIDLLNNILITDKSIRYIQQNNHQKTNSIKIGRNDKVMIESPTGDESKYIKYKYCNDLLKNGWKII